MAKPALYKINLTKKKPRMQCTITIDLFKGLKKIVSIGNLEDCKDRQVKDVLQLLAYAQSI
jgi:hypothetical protein